jgi:hypothetical protein
MREGPKSGRRRQSRTLKVASKREAGTGSEPMKRESSREDRKRREEIKREGVKPAVLSEGANVAECARRSSSGMHGTTASLENENGGERRGLSQRPRGSRRAGARGETRRGEVASLSREFVNYTWFARPEKTRRE